MEPTSSISKMLDIIRDEDIVSSYTTDQLKDILYVLQHENLTRLCDNNGHPLLWCFAGVIRPVVNPVDMTKIIRLEDALIKELRERGEIPPTKKFS